MEFRCFRLRGWGRKDGDDETRCGGGGRRLRDPIGEMEDVRAGGGLAGDDVVKDEWGGEHQLCKLILHLVSLSGWLKGVSEVQESLKVSLRA